jgi:hypothetical protein
VGILVDHNYQAAKNERLGGSRHSDKEKSYTRVRFSSPAPKPISNGFAGILSIRSRAILTIFIRHGWTADANSRVSSYST